jgi:hypothetical protein
MRGFLAFLDFLGAVVMLSCMNVVTSEATKSAAAASDRVWAWTRRSVYGLVSIALFAKGLYRLERSPDPDLIDAAAQIVIVSGLIVFPLLRASGLLSQDRLCPDVVDKLLGHLGREERRE